MLTKDAIIPRRVLIVDDNKTIRDIIRCQLSAKYEVSEAAGGEEALQCLNEKEVHLVILDVDMPGENGFEVCSKIRKIKHELVDGSSIPILFHTALDEIQDRIKGFEVGATEFVTKGTATRQILNTVNEILEPEERFKGLKAVVVDDSEPTRQMIATSLSELGLNVIEVSNGAEAFRLIRDSSMDLDLLVTENEMPEMGGVDLCRSFREKLGLKSVPVIFISTELEKEVTFQFFKAGATDYLPKPFIKEEFISRVITHLEVRRLYRTLESNHKKLQETQKLLIESEKRAAIGEMAGGAAHEINSPLAAAKLFLEMLDLDARKISEEKIRNSVREKVEKVGKNIDRVTKIVAGLLTFSRKTSRDFKEVSIAAIINELNQVSASLCEKNEIEFNFDQSELPDSQCIEGNSENIVEALSKIVDNAVEAATRSDKAWVSVHTKVLESEFLIRVRDSGSKIDAETQKKMFQPFFTTKEVGAGQGLGLSLAEGIVRSHCGTISLDESQENTCFEVRLPLKKCC